MKYSLQDLMLPAPMNGGLKMEEYWIWDGSVIKGDDGRYHMFAARCPKYHKLLPGFFTESEIIRAVSDTPEGPYQFEEVVLNRRGAQYWDGRATFNSHIKKIDDTYVLYYVGSTHPFPDADPQQPLEMTDCGVIVGRSNKRVGIATSKSVFGPWTRRDEPILKTRPDKFDNFLTSNPAPLVEEDGSVTMIYKTRGYHTQPYPEYLHGPMKLGIAKASSYDGEYHQVLDHAAFEQNGVEIEDPFLWKDKEGYHIIAKDMNGAVCGEAFGGIYAFSENGIDWDMKKDMLMYSRHVLWDDGVVREMGNLERPFLLFEDGKPTHAFFSTSNGTNGEGFMNCTEGWNMVIPLRT